jgi:hypothetical protein
MRYRIVTDGGRGRIILDDIDMLIRHVRARGWHLDGILILQAPLKGPEFCTLARIAAATVPQPPKFALGTYLRPGGEILLLP